MEIVEQKPSKHIFLFLGKGVEYAIIFFKI